MRGRRDEDCGFIWNLLGFQYVFLLGAFISFVNMFSAMRIRVPGKVLKEEEFKSFPPPEND